ncbi:MAG: phosphotransferase enzyme family protein, partial [Ktedonobacteraceae bacterium]
MPHTSHLALDNVSITSPFPVTHSILSTTALCSEILPRYELGDPVTCLFLARGVNDTYLVQTPAEKYILRVYQTGWRTLSDILYEIDVLLHLARQGIPVSRPVVQANGDMVCTLQAPEGLRHLVLFTYAPGRQLKRHDSTDTYYHGRALADLHNASDTFTSFYAREALDLAYLIDHSLKMIQPLYTGPSVDWSYLQNLAARLRTQI